MGIEQNPTVRESLERLSMTLRNPLEGCESVEEMELAATRLRQDFLPQSPSAPVGYEISVRARVGKGFASDLYDVVTLPDGRLLFVLGERSGYGPKFMPIQIALFETIRNLVRLGACPSDIVRLTHERMKESPWKSFTTLFLGLLDPATHQIDYVNAAQEPPIVLDRQGTITYLYGTGPPIDIDIVVLAEERRLSLQPGTILAVFSDGIVEAHRDTRPMIFFGHDALQKVLVDSQHDPVEKICDQVFASIDSFVDGAETQDAIVDDKTLLILRRVAEN